MLGWLHGCGRRMGVDHHHIGEFWHAAHGNAHTCIMLPKMRVILVTFHSTRARARWHWNAPYMHVLKRHGILHNWAGQNFVLVEAEDL